MLLALKIIGFVLLGLLALLAILLAVPVRLRVRYREEMSTTLWVLFVPIRLLPKKEKPEAETADKPKPKKKAKTDDDKQKQKKKDVLDLKQHAKELKENGVAAAVEWLKEIAGYLLTAADRLLKAVTVTRLFARVDIAGEDAAQTALTYGKLCGAVYPALGVVESKLKVKKQDVTIAPAFCAEKTQFAFDVRLKISLWRVVVAALLLLVQYIKMPSVEELKQRRLQRIQSHNKEAV